MTHKLYFNGINGTTGAYSLQPMTVAELVGHVVQVQDDIQRQRRALEQAFDRHTGDDRKILKLIQILTVENVRMLSSGPRASASWFTDMAAEILRLLLTSEPSQIDAAQISTFARRLRNAPVDTVTQVARLLRRGQRFELTQILMGAAVDNTAHLRESLETRFDQAVVAIEQTYLGEGAAVVNDQAHLHPDWADALCLALDQLPTPSLQALPDTDPAATGLPTLVKRLSHPRLLGRTEDRMPAVWRESLEQLSEMSSSTSWHTVVDQIYTTLRTLGETEVEVRVAPLQQAFRSWLEEVRRELTGHLGVVPWVDPKDLSEAGWGIIFPATMPDEECQAVQQALGTLLAWRRRQAGSNFRVYAGKDGYRPGDTASVFLKRRPRFADAASPADPENTGVPYYLLLVGSPTEIPYEFQHQLDVQYAVGRLDFGRDLSAYRNYAHNVVAAESEGFAQSPRAVFFAVNHPRDEATRLSAQHLVAPLYRHVASKVAGTPWHAIHVAADKASKANLVKIMQLDPPPAFLFVACHGMEFERDDDRQSNHQGALLCDDWQSAQGSLSPSSYLSVDDINSDINIRGQIAFLFACHSAGTPPRDTFYRRAFRTQPEDLADAPFTAALPKAMLMLRDRGALAVIGHLDRAWSLSFLSEVPQRPQEMEPRQREHVQVFASAIEYLLDGYPVGAALDVFNVRYAALATELTQLYDSIMDPLTVQDAYRLAELWTAHNDARGYVVIGDPAVRFQPKIITTH